DQHAIRKTRQIIEASVAWVSITQDRIARSLDIIKQTIAKLNRCSHAEPITVQTDRRRFRDFARSSRANASEVFRLSSTASACEEPEREASRCLVRPAVLVCVRDDLMPDDSCQGNRCPSFSGLRRLTARLHAKETTFMTIDVATGISRILKEEGVGWVSTFPVCRVNNALGREGVPMLMMRDDRYAVAVADAFSRITGGSRIGVCTFQGGVNAAGMQYAYAGLAQAYEDGSPVLCITDGVPAGASGNSQ